MFVGNLNNSEVISKSSFTPFMTRHVKFCPHSWINQIALRVELYGCKAEGNIMLLKEIMLSGFPAYNISTLFLTSRHLSGGIFSWEGEEH